MCKAGQEGIIAKQADAPYREGRNANWLKVKCTRRQEFVIGGYSPSDKRGRAFASLLVGAFENDRFVYQGRVGTGFNEDTMADLASRFAKLHAQDLTVRHGSGRHRPQCRLVDPDTGGGSGFCRIHR